MPKKDIDGLVAVIYARYSSENQREESIEGQLRECYEFAKKNDISVVGEYIDRAYSAKTDRRPDFQRMIKDSAKRNFNLVIVWKLDRFARNRYDSAHYKTLLKKNGVKVMSATERISDGAEGILLESVLEGMAEYYSADLSEKILRGHKENALKCKYNGGTVPIGYVVDDQKHFAPDPIKAPFVLEAFKLYDEGHTMTEIAAVMCRHKVTNFRGSDVDVCDVSRMLANRRYIGEYRYRDTVVPGGIPAIVPADLFERVQKKIAKNRKAPARHKAEDDYLLTTKLFCGYCGALMVGESGRSHTGDVHHYYRCVGVKTHNGCHKKTVRKEWIEDLVIEQIKGRLYDEVVINDLVKTFMESQFSENTVLPHLRSELSDVKRSIDNMLNAIEQGIITPSTKERLDELEGKKKSVEDEILRESLAKPMLSETEVRFWFEDLKSLDMTVLEHRKRLIDTFVNSIYLFDDHLLLNCNYPNTTQTIQLTDLKESFKGSDISLFVPPKEKAGRRPAFSFGGGARDETPCARCTLTPSFPISWHILPPSGAWMGQNPTIYTSFPCTVLTNVPGYGTIYTTKKEVPDHERSFSVPRGRHRCPCVLHAQQGRSAEKQPLRLLLLSVLLRSRPRR